MDSVVARMLMSLTLAVLIWPNSAHAGDLAAVVSRKLPPAFALSDREGSRISLSNYRGKVVLLDVWATWCAGCKVEIPWYIEFHQKYRAQGLEAIGVAMDAEGWSKVSPYLSEHPIPYTIVVGNDEFSRQYSLTALPVTLLIDRTGRIAATYIGLINKAAFERDLGALLREKTSR